MLMAKKIAWIYEDQKLGPMTSKLIKKVRSFCRNQNWEPLIYNPVKFID